MCTLKLGFKILLLKTCLFISTLGFSETPFYLTVERSFSPMEDARIRLDFNNHEIPVKIRLLKPNNIEEFLDGQLQLSRSYEEPRSEINAGYFFWKGFDKIDNPFHLMRRMLSPNFRNQVAPQLKKGVIAKNNPSFKVNQPLFRIGIPKGTTLLKEFYLNLQLDPNKAKTNSNSNVNGNEEIELYDSNTYIQKEINLGHQESGIYVVQAVQGNSEAQSIFQVSNYLAQVVQSSNDLIARIVDRKMEPVEKARLHIKLPGNKEFMKFEGTTDKNGEVWFQNLAKELPSTLLIYLQKDNERVYVDTEFLSIKEQGNSVFIFTDRPIFKPGEEIFYKGIIRKKENGELKIPFSTSVPPALNTTFTTDKGEPISESQKLPYTAFGSFSGKFSADPSSKPGLYKVIANVNDKPYAGELRVRDYIKPTFYLTLEAEHGLLRPGQKFTAKFKATHYAGGAARKVRYEYFVYRRRYEVPQWVAEAGNDLQTGFTYGGGIHSASGGEQIKRLYSSVDERMQKITAQGVAEGTEAPNKDENADTQFSGTWLTAPEVDANGEGVVNISLPEMVDETPVEWVYTLMIKAQDIQGSLAVLNKNYEATLSPVVGGIHLSSTLLEQNNQELVATIATSLPNGTKAGLVSGTMLLEYENPQGKISQVNEKDFTTSAEGRTTLPIKYSTLKQSGKYWVKARLKKFDGTILNPAYDTLARSFISLADEGKAIVDNEALELIPEKDLILPGEKIRILAILPKNWGNNETGTIWETISTDKIEKLSAQAVQGRSKYYEVIAKETYGSGFYFTLTLPKDKGRFIEQTLQLKILQNTKLIKIDINPQSNIAEPLKKFGINFTVKDFSNKPVANAELAVSIVDRALYNVQADFRPSIYNFFFPIPHFNAMSFYSDELQGYGYADEIRRPNFSLEAIKPTQALFNKTFRDTAGWFPHVITNADGLARVEVEMPGNVTEWIITAIVVDKNGRVGENKAQFRTSTDASLVQNFPQFLRKGDIVQGSLLLKNDSNVKASVDLAIKGRDEIEIIEPKEGTTYLVNPKEEWKIPTTFKATDLSREGGISITINKSNLKIGGAGDFLLKIFPDSLVQQFWALQESDAGNGVLTSKLPAAGKIVTINANVNYGFFGTILQGLKYLVNYPFGCTEQLVHSTVPNLLVWSILKSESTKNLPLGSLNNIFLNAKENAIDGFRKILANQNPDGGFSMWHGQNSTPEATLIAYKGLLLVAKLNIGLNYYSQEEKAIKYLTKLKAEFANSPKKLINFPFASETVVRIYGPEEILGEMQNLNQNPDTSFTDLANGLGILIETIEFHKYMIKNLAPYNDLITKFSGKLLSQIKNPNFPANIVESEVKQSTMRYHSSVDFLPNFTSVTSKAIGSLAALGVLPNALLENYEKFLITSMKNGYWYSTYDTAQIILNMQNIIKAESKSLERLQIQNQKIELVDRKGKSVGLLEAALGGFSGTFSPKRLEVVDALELTFKNLPARSFINAAIHVAVPNENVKELTNGLQIKREFYKAEDNNRVPLTDLTTVNPGDNIISRTTIKRLPRTQELYTTSSSYLIIEDPLPANAEVPEDEKYLLSSRKPQEKETPIMTTLRYPEKTVRIIKNNFYDAEFAVENIWRVKYKGEVILPPATCVDMYNEEIFANTKGDKVGHL